jgi:hydroxyacylglutathione hydrolase
MLDIEQIPVLRDNYIYLVHEPDTAATAAVDPAVAQPVLDALARRGWALTHILNTHHHHDHVGGNLELKASTGCTIVGHRRDAARIPGIDILVSEGEGVQLGRESAAVLDVSGHTRGHIAYWFRDCEVVFCGDTLFSLGCGRLFEGTAAEMWSSLKKLRQLPDRTRVCCAHEYTENNAAFALAIDPDNEALRVRTEEVRRLRAQGIATVPSLMAVERAANPFLRADVPALGRALGFDDGADPVAVFAEVRRLKDRF